MKFIFYYIWTGLAWTHPLISKTFIPVIKIFHKILKRTDEDYQKWKKTYSHSVLEFPGGINDWFAFGTLLILVLIVPSVILAVNIEIVRHFFSSKFNIYILFGSITIFCYYWIYYRNIDWLKEQIDKVSKKYYIK